ncbi:MAG TPA: SseB family protein [Rhodanobacteraceae bacterium]|nr:SseB family protein [Rhodanobacteraceae bacterium]
MASTTTLDDLMEQSIRDFRKEPAFFRALLEATVYTHAPLNEESERLRLVMFKSPDDGDLVIPVFTDKGKAEFAARGNVRIVSMTGRALFDVTRGTAVMINPNDARCTLYPEEISELLASGTITPIQKSQFQENETRFYKLDQVPRQLAKALKRTLPGIRTVEVAYVAGLKWQQPDHPDSLLIAFGGNADKAEQEVRAAATALHLAIERLDRPVDMVHFDRCQTLPEWIRRLGLKPVYRRRLGQTMPVSKYN